MPSTLLVSGLILFAVAFSSVFSDQWTFTNFDDDVNFLKNKRIHSLSETNIRWMLTDGTLIGVWEPVALFFKAFVFSIFGVSAQAVARANFLLHGANALLAYSTTLLFVHLNCRKKMLPQDREAWAWGAFVATMLFALHPLRGEVVGWCSAQPYLLGTFFSLLSVFAHLRHRRIVAPPKHVALLPTGSWWWWCLSLACLTLAILSKAAMISSSIMPLIVDVVLIWGAANPPSSFRESLRRLGSLLICHGSYFVVAVTSVYGAMRASNHGDVPRLELDSTETLLRAPYALVFYIVRTVVPRGLCPLYYLPPRVLATDWRFAVPALLVSSWTAGALVLLGSRAVRASKEPPTGAEKTALAWLAYIAAVSPSLGLASSHVCMLAADRYCYTAAIYIGVPMSAWLLAVAARKMVALEAISRVRTQASGVLQASALVLLLLLSASTRQVVPCWRSSEELWSRIIRVNPYEVDDGRSAAPKPSGSGPSMARGGDKRVGLESSYYNLALTVVSEGRAEYGIELYQKALAIRPHHVKSWGGMGSAYSRLERYEEAAMAFDMATQLSPENYHYRYNLGVVFMEGGKLQRAADNYRIAAALNDKDVKSRNNLGNVLRVMGDLHGAATAYKEVLALEPTHQRALKNLGVVANKLHLLQYHSTKIEKIKARELRQR